MLGLEAFVGGGTSIMDAAGAQSGSLDLEYTGNRLLRARLTDRYGFVVKTTNISGTVQHFYETFPSMVLGCHPEASECLLDTEDIQQKLQTGSSNPIKSNPHARSNQAEVEEEDKWNALVRRCSPSQCVQSPLTRLP